ncbi:MAG: tetraacyldisaccharide 4'-kinase [Candidatus Aenigmarchaeota archaeon ex4484_224]|nr:MAG: tetraacyldisaccharide 4'-kinase [Candidatus Aenigmarchaeota archaeon ex4484_224]
MKVKKLDKEFLEILRCPICGSKLEQKGMFLICKKCEKAYPILDEDVPDFLLEDAWDLEKAKKNNFMHNLKL